MSFPNIREPSVGAGQPDIWSTFGCVTALAEIVRLLTAIDKKLYVVIKKLEDTTKQEPTAEDLGYQEEDGN